MGFEPTLPSSVRAATGILWIGLGVALMLARKRTTLARWLGWFFVGFGLAAFGDNLAGMFHGVQPRVLLVVDLLLSLGYGVAFVALVMLLARAARDGAREARTALVLGATCTAIVLVGTFVALRAVFLHDPSSAQNTVLHFTSEPLSFAVVWLRSVTVDGSMAMLGAAAYYAATIARRERSVGHAWLAGGLGSFAAIFIVPTVVDIRIIPAAGSTFLMLALAVAAPALLAMVTLGSAPIRLGRALAWPILALAGLDLAVSEYTATDLGDRGIARAITFGLVGYAFLAHLTPRRSASRSHAGATATAAIAVLFIVAQVAQNFLSAQYGLVMGGVVAGAFLFAAQPLQRALEQRDGAREHSPVATDAKERSYLAAARKFHKDGVISRDEERELMILAEHLGIPTSRAYELRDQVERER